jgi:hypothetical protein
MAGNVNPIWSRRGQQSTNGTTGMAQSTTSTDTAYTGITNAQLVFTADATNGSWIERLRFKAVGTNAASNARVFINNGSTNGTATNNAFYGEISLPATTATNSAATIDLDYPMGFALMPGFRIYVVYTSTIAAGWVCVGIGGDY